MKINNTSFNARLLVNLIQQENLIPIFDLDGVLLAAGHRISLYKQADVDAGKCEANQIGALNLDHYRLNSTAKQIQQDQNLPLLEAVHLLNTMGIDYHVSTARIGCHNTLALLKNRGITPKVMMNRQGESDNRRDNALKIDNLNHHFDKDIFSRLILIDDCKANCQSFESIGSNAIHVHTEYETELS